MAMAEDVDVIGLTAIIVSAYVEKNRVASSELPALIALVHAALGGASQPEVLQPSGPEKVTAAQVRKSITPEGLISFEDNRRYQSLKRHLSTKGLTPAQYREKWGLPADYPMVAPAYAAKRSELARSIGLGRKAAPTETVVPAALDASAKRVRRTTA
jgi:predicted transcriptional regulator